jgi:arylsulfatase A-like enzyme
MRQGVRFTNAHNNCPICLPSRNSLLSGLYAHTTGNYQLWDNWHQNPSLNEAVMMPQHFKEHGYNVYGVGKIHHEGQGKADWWTQYGPGPDYGPFPWDGIQPIAAIHPDLAWLIECEFVSDYVQRYEGRDHFVSKGQLAFPWENSFAPLSNIPDCKPDPSRRIPGHKGWRTQTGMPFRYVNDGDRDRMPDEQSVDWAIDILEQAHDAPFFLGVGLIRPHTPLHVPQKYFDMFPPESLQLPQQLNGDLDDCAQALIDHCPYGFFRYGLVQQGGEALWRKWIQAYLACIAFVDEQVGRLLDALAASAHDSNTIVIFTSDNGYHMGEKQYLFKDSLWEESSQIPLIIRGPQVSHGECKLPVSLIDLYPTLIDLCSLPSHPHKATHGQPLGGHSLRSLLGNPTRDQWDGPQVALMSAKEMSGTHHSVRSVTHRYTLCTNGEEELYDHCNDPHEWHNLARDPQHVNLKNQLRQQLNALLQPINQGD